jgi:hypothetical protein
MSLFNRRLQIEIESYINPQPAIRNPQSAIRNPQSAIRNPQSAIRNPTHLSNILSNFQSPALRPHILTQKIVLSAGSPALIIDLPM